MKSKSKNKPAKRSSQKSAPVGLVVLAVVGIIKKRKPGRKRKRRHVCAKSEARGKYRPKTNCGKESRKKRSSLIFGVLSHKKVNCRNRQNAEYRCHNSQSKCRMTQ